MLDIYLLYPLSLSEELSEMVRRPVGRGTVIWGKNNAKDMEEKTKQRRKSLGCSIP